MYSNFVSFSTTFQNDCRKKLTKFEIFASIMIWIRRWKCIKTLYCLCTRYGNSRTDRQLQACSRHMCAVIVTTMISNCIKGCPISVSTTFWENNLTTECASWQICRWYNECAYRSSSTTSRTRWGRRRRTRPWCSKTSKANSTIFFNKNLKK